MSQIAVARTRARPLTERRFGSRSSASLAQLAKHVLLIAVSIVFLLPFYWMLSLRAEEQQPDLRPSELQWWPDPVHWENFATAIDLSGTFPYLRLLGNSVFYAGAVTIGTVLSCAAVGYGFARLRFPGRDLLFGITLATMMIPPIVTFIPTYILFAKTRAHSVLRAADHSPLPRRCLLHLHDAPVLPRASRATSPTPRASTAPASSASSGRSCCRWCGRR